MNKIMGEFIKNEKFSKKYNCDNDYTICKERDAIKYSIEVENCVLSKFDLIQDIYNKIIIEKFRDMTYLKLYFKHYNGNNMTTIFCGFNNDDYEIVKDYIEDEIIEIAWAEYREILIYEGILNYYIPYYSRTEFIKFVEEWKENLNFDIYNDLNGCCTDEIDLYLPEINFLQKKYKDNKLNDKKVDEEKVKIVVEFKDEIQEILIKKVNAKKVLSYIVENNNNNKMMIINGIYYGKKVEKIYMLSKDNKPINIVEG